MIRVHLFRFGEPNPLEQKDTLDEPGADAAIDQIITDVHQGKHGVGLFSLYAFPTNDSGMHLGQYYAIERFTYPRETVAIG